MTPRDLVQAWRDRAAELQDYGRPDAPRFRRADLPKNPRREREPSTTDYDPKEHAQRIAARMRVS